MKKFLFFAAAIVAVALVSCDEDILGGECTCTSSITSEEVTYDEVYMTTLGVDGCDEMGEYLTDLVDGYYTVTCK